MSVDAAPAPPADGVGMHGQFGPSRQCRERALTERTDAGGMAEKRRRVERNLEARRADARGGVHAGQVVIAPSMERMAPVTYAASCEPRYAKAPAIS